MGGDGQTCLSAGNAFQSTEQRHCLSQCSLAFTAVAASVGGLFSAAEPEKYLGNAREMPGRGRRASAVGCGRSTRNRGIWGQGDMGTEKHRDRAVPRALPAHAARAAPWAVPIPSAVPLSPLSSHLPTVNPRPFPLAFPALLTLGHP